MPTMVSPVIVAALARERTYSASLERENAELRQLLAADTVAIRERDEKIEFLESRQAPRCSTKCGLLIGGVTALVAPKVVPELVKAIGKLFGGGADGGAHLAPRPLPAGEVEGPT